MKGTIRKRGDKFQVIFPYKDDEGNWKQRSKTAATQSQANAILKKFNYEQDAVKVDNPKFSEVAKMWLSEVSLNGSYNTLRTYTYNSQFILDRISNKGIKDYTRQDLVMLYKKITKEGYEVKAYKTTFNMVMNFAIKSGYISANPGKDISTSRTNKKRPAKILNRSERLEILTSQKDSVLYYVTFLMLKTGLRIGEALGLAWENIDLDNKEINVCQQLLFTGEITEELKTENSYRKVQLDDETIELLYEFSKSPFNAGNLLFYGNSIRVLLFRSLSKFGVTPHDLRHNHGTDLLDISNIADAARRMGHTTDEYVRTYVHPTEEAQKKIAEKMNRSEYSLFDRFVTEKSEKVINLAEISASRNQET